MLAAQAIMCEDADVIVAGGMENMNLARISFIRLDTGTHASWGAHRQHDIDGLWCIFNDVHMGITAENLAELYGITREEQMNLQRASRKLKKL